MASRKRTMRKCCKHKVELVVYAAARRKKSGSALTTTIKRGTRGAFSAIGAIEVCKCSVIPSQILKLHVFTCSACHTSLGVLC